MTFHVGQEVTPKDASRPWQKLNGQPVEGWVPRQGAVYVIRSIEAWCGATYLFFDESPCGHDAKSFVPVVKPTTDISIFTRMLDEARSPELVT